MDFVIEDVPNDEYSCVIRSFMPTSMLFSFMVPDTRFVPIFNAISGINLIVLRTISSDISEQCLSVRLGFISIYASLSTTKLTSEFNEILFSDMLA